MSSALIFGCRFRAVFFAAGENYYFNARYYDPQIARFVTADNVIDGEGSTQGWNRFAYCKGNPIIYKDPTGHKSTGKDITVKPDNPMSSDNPTQSVIDNAIGNNSGIKVHVEEEKKELEGNLFSALAGKSNGLKRTYTPEKCNGKTIYFLSGFKSTSKDQGMLEAEKEKMQVGINYALKQGYKVVYQEGATKDNFKEAIYDKKAAGIYWTSHGNLNGDMETSNGAFLKASDIDKEKVSPNLKFLVLHSCGSADNKVSNQTWRDTLPASSFVEGWKGYTYPSDARDFLSSSPYDLRESHHGANPNMELRDYIDYASLSNKKP